MKNFLLTTTLLLGLAVSGFCAKLTINVGSSANDGTGDTLRTSFGKINTMMTELYAVDAALATTYQPLDSDLTAIAGLTTATYGRSLLAMANAAAARTLLGVGTGTGDALVSDTLAQFAPTSSAELKSLLSDENGTTGKVIFADGTLVIATGQTLTVTTGGTLGTAAYTATTAYEVPLTFSTGLTRTTNSITVNTSQNIATLSNLTGNGFVKTTGGAGTLSIDTSTYLTTTGNGASLTGITQSQVSGLTTTDVPVFSNVRITHSTLTYAATTTVDFIADGFQTETLTGNVTFATSNLAAGRSKTIRIIGDSSSRTLTFPAWKFVGAAAPTALAASKVAVLTLTSFSTTDANVVAAYAVEP